MTEHNKQVIFLDPISCMVVLILWEVGIQLTIMLFPYFLLLRFNRVAIGLISAYVLFTSLLLFAGIISEDGYSYFIEYDDRFIKGKLWQIKEIKFDDICEINPANSGKCNFGIVAKTIVPKQEVFIPYKKSTDKFVITVITKSNIGIDKKEEMINCYNNYKKLNKLY